MAKPGDFQSWRMAKRLRHNADDRVARVIERDLLSKHIAASAELLLPEIVTDDRDARTAWLVFGFGKITAEHWFQAENVEEIGADARGRENLGGLAGGRDSRRPARSRTDSFKNISSVLSPLPHRFLGQIQ